MLFRPSHHRPAGIRAAWRAFVLSALSAVALTVASCGRKPPAPAIQFSELAPGLSYANQRITNVPWSIHIVRVDRQDPGLEIHSVHAGRGALGLSKLTDQIQQVPAALGTPVAAVNGDFYQRDRAYAGDPRGLQISDGELLSGPVGGVAFWIDATGQPHTAEVTSQLQVSWPDGSASPFGLNDDRKPDAVVLYTPAVGASTRTSGGREFVLEPESGASAMPLHAGAEFTARVKEVREVGDTTLRPGTLVLSVGPQAAKKLLPIAVGAVFRLSTATTPGLRDARAALGGGPVLVQGGKALKVKPPSSESYEFSSMIEQHPRSAIGWDDRYLYLVEVDGRQEKLSIGMTLDELAEQMAGLGCTEAMNLDGGGSATLWCEGKVRNSPCDGGERPIANALVVLRKAGATSGAAK